MLFFSCKPPCFFSAMKHERGRMSGFYPKNASNIYAALKSRQSPAADKKTAVTCLRSKKPGS